MPMNTYIAKVDYFSLVKGCTYFRIYCESAKDIVILVAFSDMRGKRDATRINLSRDCFEKGLEDGHIVHHPDETTLPPHLQRVEGLNCAQLDADKKGRLNLAPECKQGPTHGPQFPTDLAQKRLLNIAPLVAKKNEILTASDPEGLINSFAKANGLNSGRTRLHFFTYIAYGENVWSLLPATIANGAAWDPLSNPDGKPLGRRRNGEVTAARPRMTRESIALSLEGYDKCAELCLSMKKIYVKVMSDYFRAKVVHQNGKHYLQPTNKLPLPSFRQFKYQVLKRYGLQQIRTRKLGFITYNNRFQPQVGKTTYEIANALERLELDGYFTKDRPTGRIDKSLLPSLCVVTIVCVGTGMIVGIGFSLGHEVSEAYNMARWCCAIAKQRFCRALGLEIKLEEWPTIIAPADEIFDRGPGVKHAPGDFVAHVDGDKQIVIRQLIESERGKGKPNVESSHRRSTQLDQAKPVRQSDLCTVQMVRREVLNAIASNKASDAADRMSSAMDIAETTPSPLGVYNYLASRERVVRRTLPFDDATRRFLPKIDAVITHKGVQIGSQTYHSEELAISGILLKARKRSIPAHCYVLPICARTVWVEIDGRLIEVYAIQPWNDSSELLDETHAELSQRHDLRNALREILSGKVWQLKSMRAREFKPLTERIQKAEGT